jgi:predicted dehydrogenase
VHERVGRSTWRDGPRESRGVRAPDSTFGDLRIDGTRGHVTMDASSVIRVKRLGEPARELDYVRERKNFAGDCVYFLQRHFVDCLLSGRPFESSGEDYLHNVRIVEAAYESAQKHASVRLE